MCYNTKMTNTCMELIRKIGSVDESFMWIEQQADQLLVDFDTIVKKVEVGQAGENDYSQLNSIERRMSELEARAKINTAFYNATVDEARKYFKQYHGTDLPPSIRKLI